ncbi:F-box protein SNE [Sorghum bicolor]|uniref:F-box protein SNE n=1 Tax=Sorghum bicolor TaxID=4558 RepID=UPI0001A8294F|nr:F-box protein SNE [Sorghum bicolor]|eukprot:XP_002465701.1 F-box protein SNE [Sorghum bicolor]
MPTIQRAEMGGAGAGVPRRPGEAVEVTELQLRIQLLGGGGGVGGAGSGSYNINDNADILAEILSRLDGRSLAAAACVCRLWAAVARRDAVWEALCLRHVGPPAPPAAAGPATRAVVAALGGYRRLYRLCLGPALDRLAQVQAQAQAARAHHLSLSLSLSLFSIDCYERLGGGGASAAGAGKGKPGRQQQPSSLLFLCKPVDVS